MTQVFVDLDGVLADFDGHYERLFGRRPDKKTDDVDWQEVGRYPGFYASIPLMPDALELWSFLSSLKNKPIILTGCPKLVPESADDKRLMVRAALGPEVKVITCASSDKWRYAMPGDVLVDDWEKYRHFWEGAGGRWITHTSADSSIQQLLELGIGF